jgi:hypothetical protein
MSDIKHKSWPDIEQFRNVIRNVKDHAAFVKLDEQGEPVFDYLRPIPKLKFRGTTKLHGSNAAIGLRFTAGTIDTVWFQSRSNVITVENDNAGFSRFIQSIFDSGIRPAELLNMDIISKYLLHMDGSGEVVLFGEWCGGNIQKGVALNQIPKMFVLFGVHVEHNTGSFYLPDEDVAQFPTHPEQNLFNVYEAQTFEIEIDFARPELSQAEMIKLVEAVEAKCPWGVKFGVEGTGEGIVWHCITPGYGTPKFWFKTKGEKHSVSKVKTLVPVDIEKANSQAQFIENTVTTQRCEQSITKLREAGITQIDRTHMGEFIRWIYADIVKEESDTATGSGLDLKKMGGPIAAAAKKYFFQNEASF